jgi:nicotinamide-nucleotide amidase
MSLSIIIMSTGSEITTGKSLDTNSMWIANELSLNGYIAERFIVLPDSPSIIKEEILRFSNSTQPTLIIMTGGLGATLDDHTLNVVLDILNSPKIRIESAYNKLVSSSEKRGPKYMEILGVTSKQTYVPETATPLQNTVGIAPGFFLKISDSLWFSAMPGVPIEMKAMFSNELLPIILENFPIVKKLYLSKYIWNMTEGLYQKDFINQNLSFIQENSIEWGVTARAGHIKVSFLSESKDILDSILDRLQILYKDLLTDDILESVHNLLIKKKETLSTAESCTGGFIGKSITDLSGSSIYYLGSIVSYHNEIKEKLLNVKKESLEKYGAVSEEVAREMVLGLESKFQTTYTISVTGIAGPTGGTEEKPVGTVFIGIKKANREIKIYKHLFPYGRESFRNAVVQVSLYYLYREILQN